MFSKNLGIAAFTLACAWPSAAAFAAPAQDPIRIGLVTSISGVFAPQGDDVQRGVKFAVDEANAHGGIAGRKVEVQSGDDESTPEAGRRAAEKLARNGYNLLTGAISSAISLALSQSLDRWNALYISANSKSDRLTGDACKMRMFRVNQSDSMDITMLSLWLKSVPQKKFAIVAADYAWGHDSADLFTQAAQKLGKQVVLTVSAPMGTKDFAPYISQVKASGADAVWVALVGEDTIAFAKQSAQFALPAAARIIGHAQLLGFTVAAAGTAMTGTEGNIVYAPEIPTPLNKSFVANWRKTYHRDPSDVEAASYNGVQVIFQGVQESGSVQPLDVAKALGGLKMNSIFGPTVMRAADHQLEMPDYIGQVKVVNGTATAVLEQTFEAPSVVPPVSHACVLPAA
ncbi:MAG: ABC transporter substrate-binding protein [Janthinobacterium lividum]